MQALTSADQLAPEERKRQREALRRRMQQPGPWHLFGRDTAYMHVYLYIL